MNSKQILTTAHIDTLPPDLKHGDTVPKHILHLSLEHFAYSVDEEMHENVERELNNFAYVIHGNKLSARYFLRWMLEYGELERTQQLVHLVTDESTAELLEAHNIPAVKPRDDAKPIDLIEFLLRVSYEGKILYPCSDQKIDEIPGLLMELELPFVEFQVFEEQTLKKSDLETYRESLQKADLAGIIFHNDSSVLRTITAFSNIEIQHVTAISANGRVTGKLKQAGVKNIREANGSWKKLAGIAAELAR